MAERSYRWLLWTLVLVGFTLDQGSKYVVFRVLYNEGKDGQYVIVNGAFELLAQSSKERETSAGLLASMRTWSGDVLPKVNQGALFGLGGEYGPLANMIFAIVSILAAVAIVFWSTRATTMRDPSLCAALGLILAGTLGNLYDRLLFSGVRDFLHFHYFEFPVFNVADSCLVCGACLLLIQAFLNQPAPASQEGDQKVLLAAAETK
jgi:lipoprotein signal peptidase